MCGQDDRRHPDTVIRDLASSRHGVVARAELVAAGLSRRVIDHRLAIGRLRSVHRGIYAVGPLTREGRWLAATLACGSGAALSHLDAAALWGLVPLGSGPLHVTVPARTGRSSQRGIRLHRIPLAMVEVTRRNAIPVTTPARTLIDIAACLPHRRLERALDEAHYLRRLNSDALRAALARNHSRVGAHMLKRVLKEHLVGSTRTRSELEERFLALCREHCLPMPQVNARVADMEVDFLWRAERLVVETDGYAAHRSRAAFERDHDRDARLRAADHGVLRFTYRQITARGSDVAASVRRELRSPGGRRA